MAHPVYSKEATETIKITHQLPHGVIDHIALGTINTARKAADVLSRYNPDDMTERKWLDRCIFLETVAGIPGMVGGMHRHMRSLRNLEEDRGWIHHLLQEAETERMHLFFFLTMRKPGVLFRSLIGVA